MTDPGGPQSPPGPAAVPDRHRAPEVEDLLRQVMDLIDQARPMPLSTSAMINREEVLELVTAAIDRLPEELRAARWLLKERDEYLARSQREADDILDEARAQSGRLVQRTEVMRAAEQRARQVVEAAEADARRVRHQVEDYCDQRLTTFEGALQRTMQSIADARGKLQPDSQTGPAGGGAEDLSDVAAFSPEADGPPGFFDQDA